MEHEAWVPHPDGRSSDVAKRGYAGDLTLGGTIPLVAHILII